MNEINAGGCPTMRHGLHPSAHRTDRQYEEGAAWVESAGGTAPETAGGCRERKEPPSLRKPIGDNEPIQFLAADTIMFTPIMLEMLPIMLPIMHILPIIHAYNTACSAYAAYSTYKAYSVYAASSAYEAYPIMHAYAACL